MTTEDSGPSAQPADVSTLKPDGSNDALSSQRVFKKSSPNGKLTLYLSSRDLVVSQGKIDRLQGVLLVDPEFVENKKVYGQVTLTFRYGREDEEVMGLKFCNEAIMCLAQLYPPHSIAQPPEGNTPLQEALVKRLGPNAYPFSMEITPLAPPSVQLVPAKEYHGAPIGTSYDIRAYIAERADEKFHRRTTVRMGIRVVQRAFAPPSPYLYNPSAFSSSHKERAKDHRKALFGSKSLEVGFPTKDVNHVAARTPEHGCNLDDFSNDNDTKMSPLIKNNVNTENSRFCGDVDGGKNGVVDKHDADVIPGSQEHNKCTGHGKSHVTFKGPLTNGDDKKSSQGSDLIERCDKPPDENTNNNSPISAKEKNTFDNENLEEYRSLCGGKRPSLAAYLAGVPAPKAAVEKPFLLSDGRVYLAASLDKAIYSHGEEVQVSVHVQNGSNKTIRRIKVFVVQHVDVCMFSNGKFKNVVALINSKEDCPVTSGSIFDKTFTLLPLKSSTKNWIALEDSYTKSGTSLSSTVTCITDNPDERNVFAIYVSYYVKVKLLVSVMGGEVSLKLPFTLMHTCSDFEASETLTKVRRPDATASVELELKMNPSVKPEKDGT